MDLVYQSTEEFEKEINVMDKSEKELIISNINVLFNLCIENKKEFYSHIRRLNRFKLKNGLTPTLFEIKVTPIIRVIFTIDEDPLFDETIITLFRVVHKTKARGAYEEVRTMIYKDLMEKDGD